MISYKDNDGNLIFPYEIGSEEFPMWEIGKMGERGDECIIIKYLSGMYGTYESAARALEKYAKEHNLEPGY